MASSETISAADVRERALYGTVLLTAKGFLLQGAGLATTIVIARALGPGELGIVAFGLTVTTFAAFLGGGQALGGALIRAPEPPDRRDLEAVAGLQLLVTLGLVSVVASAMWPFGQIGQITTLMICALPFAALRVPGAVMLERALAYRTIVVVEGTEMLVYYGWSVATVLAGWGVWGLASAVVVRAAAGLILMLSLAPLGLTVPRFSWSRSRRLIGFGARLQGTELVHALRDQGLNLTTAAVAGLTTLGLWSLAYRTLQAPALIFDSLLRVSFPAMSRIVAMKGDAVALIERALVVGTVACGLILAPLAASSPALVPAIFGSKWAEAAAILPPSCLGLVIGLPVTLGLTGYLWAIGDAQVPLRASIANGAVLLLVAAALLPFMGAAAIGIGFVAAAVAGAAVLRRGAARHVDLRLSPLATPTIAWLGAVALGWIATSRLDANLAGAASGAVLAEALYVGAMLVLARRQLRQTVTFARGALRGQLAAVRSRPAEAAARA